MAGACDTSDSNRNAVPMHNVKGTHHGWCGVIGREGEAEGERQRCERDDETQQTTGAEAKRLRKAMHCFEYTFGGIALVDTRIVSFESTFDAVQ
jgi:hypothetical protein